MLTLNNIEVMYSDVILAVKGISVSVGEGQCVVLLGANGAGKSTTLKAISGLLISQDGAVTSGSVSHKGEKINGMAPERVAARGIAHITEGRPILQHLTVDQNLTVGGHLLGSSVEVQRRKEEIFARIPRLADLRGRVSGYLSGGEQQMLLIGRALMSRPQVVLIDEPSMGLAPQIIESVYGILRDCKAEGVSLLIVEQNATDVLDFADYGYVLENGRVVMEGTARDLVDNDDIREFYLGIDASGTRKNFKEIKHYRRRKRWVG